MGHAVALRSLRLFSAINLVEAELGWEIESVRSLDFFQPQIAGLDVFQFQNGRFHRGVAHDQLPRSEKSSNDSIGANRNADD